MGVGSRLQELFRYVAKGEKLPNLGSADRNDKDCGRPRVGPPPASEARTPRCSDCRAEAGKPIFTASQEQPAR